MDRERLFSHLEQYYYPKKDILNRLPLGVPLEGFWQELLNRRKGRSILLPLHSPGGNPYWYVVTEKMIAASERVIEELMENETSFDPYRANVSVSTLEEIYYTTYVEGAMISMQDAMAFLQSDEDPRDINEQMILNNRQASSYVAGNLYNPVDEPYICNLAYILTERMDNGGGSYRTSDTHEIPFMGKERYAVPLAAAIPDRMRELIRFLQESSVHPLIKAGVAQAWVLMVRPFSEGNERLARLLSTVILLRAGYTFFGEVSLSAIIARQSYEYYNATANILRPENGEDLTYFLEYFLNLLVRALDERKIRIAQRVAREQEAERMLAAQPLSPDEHSPGMTESRPAASYADSVRREDASVTSCEEDVLSMFAEEMDGKEVEGGAESSPQSHEGEDGGVIEAIRQKLHMARYTSHLMPPVVDALEKLLNQGVHMFMRQQLIGGLDYTPKQAETVFSRLRDMGIIQSSHRENKKMVYCFAGMEDRVPVEGNYSEELIERAQRLAKSAASAKDKRIGSLILEKLSVGVISYHDYEERGRETCWGPDMRFAEQMGLVQKIDREEYQIQAVPKENYALLLPAQKAIASAMYREFGEEVFSLEMVVATLEYSPSHVSAVLHQFTLLRILNCTRENVNWYQFLVTPEGNPECFVA